jgi:hypothetical protein
MMSLRHINCLLWLLLALGLAAGCKKEAAAPAADTPPLPQDQTTAAAEAPPSRGRPVPEAPLAPSVIPANADVDATLQQLSLELRKYVVRTRSVPKTFEEFVEKSRVQAPPAPAGKKYAIEGQAVVLVKS